ncbi:MAG: DMT family transporter [Vicinamibacteria bacterium]|jgi:drug/metabolite transporter (DMT)-like permease|nr:DMT family transporter [Vicinamibacteria bacterium]
MNAQRLTLPRLGVITAAVLFSTGGAAIKGCALSGWQIAGLRSALAAAMLIALLPGARRGWTLRALLVGCAHAATLVSFVCANKLTTAANAIFLQATAPLYLLILGPWLLKERVRGRDVMFICVLAAGLSSLLLGSDPPTAIAANPLAGNLLGVLSGLLWALTLLGLRLMSRGTHATPDGALPAVAIGNVLAFWMSLPGAWPIVSVAPRDWIILAFLGLIQVGLAYIFLVRSMRHVPAFEASLLLLFEPVFNPVWAFLMQGEAPNGWALLGGGLILATTVARTLLTPAPEAPALPPST